MCQQRVGGSAEGRDAWRRLTRWQHGRGDLDKGKGTKEGNHTKADVNFLPVNMFHCIALCKHKPLNLKNTHHLSHTVFHEREEKKNRKLFPFSLSPT